MTDQTSIHRPSVDTVHAHRGASAVAPENTLAAFKAAHGQKARWIEFDVSLLADGTPVVIHDATIDRCTDRTGEVRSLKPADLKNIDAGSCFDAFYKGEAIPTLAATLECFGKFGLAGNLEIKRHAHDETIRPLVEAVHEQLRKRPAGVDIMISSFSVEALKIMHELDPSIELAVLWDRLPADWREILDQVPTKSIHLNYKSLSFELLAETNRRGLIVRVWTCDSPDEIAPYWEAGLAGVITNDPRLYLG